MNITEWPRELQVYLFSFCDVASLGAASQTCQKWRGLIQNKDNDKIIWQAAFEKRFGYASFPSIDSEFTFRELARQFKLYKQATYHEWTLVYQGPTAITSHYVFLQRERRIQCTNLLTNNLLPYTLPDLPQVLHQMELSSITKDIIQIKAQVTLDNAFRGPLILYDVSDKQSGSILFSTNRPYGGRTRTPLLNASQQASNRIFYLSDQGYFSFFDIKEKKTHHFEKVEIDATLAPLDLFFIEGDDQFALFNLKTDNLQVVDIATGTVDSFTTRDIGFQACPITNDVALITNNKLILYQKTFLLILDLATKKHTKIPLSGTPKLSNKHFLITEQNTHLLVWNLDTLQNTPSTIPLDEGCAPLFLHDNKLLVRTQTGLSIWNLLTESDEQTISLDSSHDPKVMGYFEHFVWIAIKTSQPPDPEFLFMFIDMYSGIVFRKDTYKGTIELAAYPRCDNRNSISFNRDGYSFTDNINNNSLYGQISPKKIIIRTFTPPQHGAVSHQLSLIQRLCRLFSCLSMH